MADNIDPDAIDRAKTAYEALKAQAALADLEGVMKE